MKPLNKKTVPHSSGVQQTWHLNWKSNNSVVGTTSVAIFDRPAWEAVSDKVLTMFDVRVDKSN